MVYCVFFGHVLYLRHQIFNDRNIPNFGLYRTFEYTILTNIYVTQNRIYESNIFILLMLKYYFIKNKYIMPVVQVHGILYVLCIGYILYIMLAYTGNMIQKLSCSLLYRTRYIYLVRKKNLM